MKVLRVLPKSYRKKMLINELQRFRKSKDRKQMLKAVRDGSIVSKILKKQAEETAKAADEYHGPGGPTARMMLRSDSKDTLKRSQEIENQTKQFASTKKERARLRKFWGLQK